jgi:pimeloyl-ACP methyl ester carboxylesterase
LEPLENRLPTAADLFAALVATPASDWAAAGQALAVSAQVQNIGDTVAGSFQVEYRLSADSVITTADTLLGTTSQTGLAAGGTADLSRSVTVPAATAKGVYYVGVRIVASDADAANNTAAETTTTAVYLTSLTGTVKYGTSTKSVAIRPYLGGGTPIFDDRPTWIVIHGRNSSPSVSYLAGLSAAIDGFSASDQVLVLDWSAAAASGWIGGAGENYIIPVGSWMAGKLSSYGLTPDELNLVGHSWGAYIAAETAERVPAAVGATPQVNSIIALDPAADYPGGSYNPTSAGQVNFARNSRISWALYASGGTYGSATTAATAHESIVVKGSDHTKLVSVFTDVVRMNYDGRQNIGNTSSIVANLNLQRLLSPTLNTAWALNRYNSSGSKTSAPFESVIDAASGGTALKTFRYVAVATLVEQVLTV